MNALLPHLERSALLSLEKSAKLARLQGDGQVDIDLDAGTIRLGDGPAFPCQVLGTESDNTLTWLWAWADEQTEVPAALLKASLEMRTWLEQNGLGRYAAPSLDLDAADGTVLSLIACSVCSASAWYRDDYAGGSAFLLLYGREIDRQPDLTRAELSRGLADIASRYTVDVRNALASYFRTKGLPLKETADEVKGELANGEVVLARFEGGRLTEWNGSPWE